MLENIKKGSIVLSWMITAITIALALVCLNIANDATTVKEAYKAELERVCGEILLERDNASQVLTEEKIDEKMGDNAAKESFNKRWITAYDSRVRIFKIEDDPNDNFNIEEDPNNFPDN